jgi:hypothetical protein
VITTVTLVQIPLQIVLHVKSIQASSCTTIFVFRIVHQATTLIPLLKFVLIVTQLVRTVLVSAQMHALLVRDPDIYINNNVYNYVLI